MTRVTFDLSDAPADSQEHTKRGKVICSLCGSSGWPPHWWNHHRAQLHVRCDECGRWYVESVIRRHIAVVHKGRHVTSDPFTTHDLYHAATTIADILNEEFDGYRTNVHPADVLRALDQLGMTLTPDPTNEARHAANQPG